jgi:hypothetical protein
VFLGGLTSFTDLDIVTAHLTLAHLAVFRKRPVLETVTPLPLHAIVGILIFIPDSMSCGTGRSRYLDLPKLDGNLVICKGEQLFPQTVALLFLPFLGQESLDGCSTY